MNEASVQKKVDSHVENEGFHGNHKFLIVEIPGKAEALAGQKIKIQVQCQDSESGNTLWDDSAPRISCIETSIKVSFWLEKSSEQECTLNNWTCFIL